LLQTRHFYFGRESIDNIWVIDQPTTAAETEKHKSTATEKPEASVQVEGTIKQGKVYNEINKMFKTLQYFIG